MLTAYDAYLIRRWRQENEVSRVEVVHIQTGERLLVQSTAAAFEWIDRHRGGDTVGTTG